MNALRRTLIAGLALLAGAPAFASSEAVKTYRKDVARVVARQKTWEAKARDEDLRAAADVLVAPWRERGGPDAPKVIDYDFAGYAEVYERCADFGRERGRLAIALAESGGEEAAAQIVSSLAAVLVEIAALDRAIREVKPLSRGIVDQAPGMKRYAAWLERDLLVEALRKTGDAEAAAYLAKKGWAAAEEADRKAHGDHVRIAVLDGLTAANAALAGEQTRAAEPRLRIAALEALARVQPGEPTQVVLRTAAEGDPCRTVRSAAAALLPAPPAGAPEGAPAFASVPVAGLRVLVLLDTSTPTVKPADVELMKEKSLSEWRAIAEKDRDYVTQLGWACARTRDFLAALPAEARFDVLDLGDGDRITALSPRGLLPAGDAGRRQAAEFLGARVPGGYVSQLEGLWEASRRAGIDPFGAALPDDPEADAMILVSNGVPHGGPIMHGPALLDDVRRRHRFARIAIHAIRLDDCAAPAEEVMKGIAEVTGGVYVHVTQP